MLKGYIRNIKKIDKVLLVLTIFMFIFGLIAMTSASYVKSTYNYENPYHFLINQSIVLVICLFAFFFLIAISTNFYKKNYNLVIIGCVLSLLLLFEFGINVNGAVSWYRIGRFSLQPSEFAKIGLILYLAGYYYKYKDNTSDIKSFLFPIVPILIIFLLIFKQPDLGSSIIFLGIAFAMVLAVPKYPTIKKIFNKTLITGTIVALIAIIVVILSGNKILYSYQLNRLNFLNPCQRYTEVGTGYQVCNSYIAINNGGLFGVGIGNSTQKYLYLPEAETDAIFPVIVEEWGLLVGIVIIFIYALIIYRIIRIGKKSKNLFGGLFCFGTASYILIHIVINLGGIFGLMPLTGVPLPFLSYGGSFALSLTIALTIVQRVNIENKLSKDEETIKNKIREI